MKLYVFASSTLTNIWAGIGARRWAVSKSQADNVGGIIAKAEKMLIGSVGLIYCEKIPGFTTPFVVYSAPNKNEVIKDVWPEEWTLPFGIHPLGTPRKSLKTELAKQLLPILSGNDRSWHHIFHVQPTTAFVATEISEQDWEVLVEHLADRQEADSLATCK